MIEIPEAVTLSVQLSECFLHKTITQVRAGISPHKFAWYYGDPQSYSDIAVGRTFRGAKPVGGMVEADLGDIRLLFSEGVNLRRLNPGDRLPEKRQMEVTFSDSSILVASVQMYGGMGVFLAGRNDNPYYLISQKKPSPLEDEFDASYFDQLISGPGIEKLSAKGFLATEQRIPGLGNGVLQDILYQARVSPKRKIAALSDRQRERLFGAVKNTLREMSDSQGRDTELDLFGKPGKYRTIMSRNNAGKPCPTCGSPIQKAAYMGGSVYFCQECQP